MTTVRRNHRLRPDQQDRAIARTEGITLTPRGEPLLARDLPHWHEIKASRCNCARCQADATAIAEDGARLAASLELAGRR